MDFQPEWLLKAEVKAVVTMILMGILSGGGWLISRRWGKLGIVSLDADAGHTTTAPSISVLSVICALFAIAIFIYGEFGGVDDSITNDRLAWSLLVIGFGLGAFLLALMTGFRWAWDADGIAFKGFWRTRFFPWCDVVQFVRRQEGPSFVKDKLGKKITWTKYTLHPDILERAVAKYRPDLVAA